jgi:hypothetical protein
MQYSDTQLEQLRHLLATTLLNEYGIRILPKHLFVETITEPQKRELIRFYLSTSHEQLTNETLEAIKTKLGPKLFEKVTSSEKFQQNNKPYGFSIENIIAIIQAFDPAAKIPAWYARRERSRSFNQTAAPSSTTAMVLNTMSQGASTESIFTNPSIPSPSSSLSSLPSSISASTSNISSLASSDIRSTTDSVSSRSTNISNQSLASQPPSLTKAGTNIRSKAPSKENSPQSSKTKATHSFLSALKSCVDDPRWNKLGKILFFDAKTPARIESMRKLLKPLNTGNQQQIFESIKAIVASLAPSVDNLNDKPFFRNQYTHRFYFALFNAISATEGPSFDIFEKELRAQGIVVDIKPQLTNITTTEKEPIRLSFK